MNAKVKKHHEMLEGIGFVEDVTNVVIAKLQAKQNKGNMEIIKRIEESAYYEVLKNANGTFTVHAQCLVTKQEIKKFEKFVGATYVKAGEIIDESGLWDEWISC